MSTPYLSRVVTNLQKVWDFTSPQRGAPAEVELDVPIQPVLDLSRIAGLGTGIGAGGSQGYWTMGVRNIHTVTGVLSQSRDPSNPTAGMNGFPQSYNPDDFWTWVIACWGETNDASDFVQALVIINNAATAIGPRDAVGPIARFAIWRATGAMTVAGGDSPLGTATGNTNPYNFGQGAAPLPVLERNDGANATIEFVTQADNGGTVTVDINCLLWVGSKGATPPGLS